MQTKPYTTLTPQELLDIRSEPGGIDRLINLQTKFILELKVQTQNVLAEMRELEQDATSWISLIIVLGIMQIFQTGEYAKYYLLMSLPSFVTAFLFAILTKLNHISFTTPDFFVIEDHDKDLIIEKNDFEIKSRVDIYNKFHRVYNRKVIYAKFISPSVFINFFLNCVFLMATTYNPYLLNYMVSLAIGVLSVLFMVVLVIPKLKSARYKKTWDLNAGTTEGTS